MEALRPYESTVTGWTERLIGSNGIRENGNHFWAKDPNLLSTTSNIEDFATGTGEQIFTDIIKPLISSAQQEVILVTCFWASSPSLQILSAALIDLSRKSIRRGTSKVRVRLCFSSRSFWQKLFHNRSPHGEVYPPSTWISKLGLPAPDQLQGLDLQVKSLFSLPFSVLHPKYIIVDRHIAVLPSCNVSWEVWLECYLQVSGPVVFQLLKFWQEIWNLGSKSDLDDLALQQGSGSGHGVRSVLLPSLHHCNPRFRPFMEAPLPPPTPLNEFLLHAFKNAKRSINITTPNLTCEPVLASLLDALVLGVNVNITTCRRMMVAEQLVTAGKTTEYCVWRLMRRYKRRLQTKRSFTPQPGPPKPLGSLRDVEGGQGKPGRLQIAYFLPTPASPAVKCHIKCTIIDDVVAILGSGNMDRASWYTSQELGYALEGRDAVSQVVSELHEAKARFVEIYYDSG